MNTTSISHADPQIEVSGRKVFDVPIRVFHALMVVCFTVAYVTAESEHWRTVHVTMGYTLIGLLVFRVIWGWLGPKPSQWKSWGARIKSAWRTLSQWRESRHQPGTWQISAVTLSVVLLVLSMSVTLATGFVNEQEWLGDALEEVHEVAGNFALTAVLAHIATVVLGIMKKGWTAVTSIWTGRSASNGPSLIVKDRVWLGALIVLMTLGFWAYQWQQFDKLSGEPLSMSSHARHHDHDDDDD